MPGINLTAYLDIQGALGEVPQSMLGNIRTASISTEGGVEVLLGNSMYTIRYITMTDSFLAHAGNNIDVSGTEGDSQQSIVNRYILCQQLNSGRVYVRSLSSISEAFSGEEQRILDKIDSCSFSTRQAGFQVSDEHLTCPITLIIPEQGVFARTSLQSDVCCLYDATALKELVSRSQSHPVSREAMAEAHIVPKDLCHFDLGKGAFIHSGSESASR